MRLILWLALAALAIPTRATAQDAQQRIEWNRPFAPFNIVDNVHYVGTKGLSAFLITGPNGHILIDGGLPESAPLIAANIKALGFRLQDVKYLLINHTHFDHAGGLAELKRLTGAKVVASAAQQADLESGKTIGRPGLAPFPPVRVDRIVHNGDLLVLGPITLLAIASPGHTRGGVSWLLVNTGLRVMFATSLTVAGQNLVNDPVYPRAAADFRKTFARLRAQKADVFVNFHPDFFNLAEKRAAQRGGKANAFIDPGELQRQIDSAEVAFQQELARQETTRKAP
ncbi:MULTISPECIES: subclass B3 metallo-beta-lactamase [unclassified Sphingomonas]|uniref:subclass B3 metallo-beta-lactamase n=1 Tax=unclassified Sphingomonas TaxID=196159 RepID=UPI000BCAB3C2|nr:MAG: subclass B3 metallo-beta-lactamase [Sphingomonas sp. 32-62-10]